MVLGYGLDTLENGTEGERGRLDLIITDNATLTAEGTIGLVPRRDADPERGHACRHEELSDVQRRRKPRRYLRLVGGHHDGVPHLRRHDLAPDRLRRREDARRR